MSQEKIDKRKAEKINRKKQLAKKNKKRMMNLVVSIFATAAFIAVVCLAAMQLSGKLDKPTTTPTVSYSEEELASIRNALGITTTADEGETSSDSSDATTAPENESTSEEATSEENGETSVNISVMVPWLPQRSIKRLHLLLQRKSQQSWQAMICLKWWKWSSRALLIS